MVLLGSHPNGRPVLAWPTRVLMMENVQIPKILNWPNSGKGLMIGIR